jgi:hypothetical protein
MTDPLSAYIHRNFLVDSTGAQSENVNKVASYVWDSVGLQWIKATSSGGGGGGAVSIADGSDVAEGVTTDAAVFGDAAGTLSAKLRGINALLKGVGTASAPATASITSADSVAVAANASRKKLVITNIGTANVYFGDGTTAALNSGIVLTPNGTWVMDNYTFSTAAIHAICASTSTLAIQEYQ